MIGRDATGHWTVVVNFRIKQAMGWLALVLVTFAVACGGSTSSSTDVAVDGTVTRDGLGDLGTHDQKISLDLSQQDRLADTSGQPDLNDTIGGEETQGPDLSTSHDSSAADTAQMDNASPADLQTKDTQSPVDTSEPMDLTDTAVADLANGIDQSAPDLGQPDLGQPDLGQPDLGSGVDSLTQNDTSSSMTAPVIGGCQIFPEDNPWNRDISKEPVDPNSANIIAAIGSGTGLHPDFGTVWDGAPNGIPYVLVGGNQKLVNITFDEPDESDSGPYPIPGNAPIEGGPDGDGDRHILVLRTSDCKLFETFYTFPTQNGWKAYSGAVFDLGSNALRPDTWTSADAAGLPIFPGLVKYDEVLAGEIKHALRFTVSISRRAFVHPATHWASSNTDSNRPPMGMRVRLKANVDISGFSPKIQVILKALKKYGMFMADNGSNWYISGAPDSRWSDDELATLGQIKGGDFEVVKMGKIYTPADF